jgi:RNA polymerase sigma factor for flagellar operon FliA
MTSDDDPRSAEHTVAELWSEYKATGDLELRNRLVVQHAPLVKYVVGRVRAGLPQNVDGNDLVSEGVVGLIDAIEKFDPGRGLQFQTYAVARIRGAIIDSLRASDWVPRSVRSRLREIERAQATLEATLGRSPDDEEMAAELGVTMTELQETYARAAYTSVASLDEIGMSGEDVGPATPGLDEADDEMKQALGQVVRQLPERDQVIIALYYYEGLTLSEIGQVLGVSESRVSQLHTRAALSLRSKLQAMSAA